jgi:hypothetical protein
MVRSIVCVLYVLDCLIFPPPSIAQNDPPHKPVPPTKQIEPAIIDRGALPPAVDLVAPKSARLGEMVILQIANPVNVDFCSWDIDPPPDSIAIIDVVKRIPGTTQYALDGPPKREVHFSSTTVGTFTATVYFSGPGGVNHAKQRIIYGTKSDGNAAASARENMAMDEADDFESIIVQALRAVDDPKPSHRVDLADAIDEAISLADGPNPNVSEFPFPAALLRTSAQRHLKTSYADWTKFLRTLSLVRSDAVNDGQIKTLDDDLKVLRATSAILRGDR